MPAATGPSGPRPFSAHGITASRKAYRAALAWLDSGWAERPASVAGQPVFTQCDPSLATFERQASRLLDLLGST